MVSARVKDSDGSLNDAIQEIEKLLVDRIGNLKAAVSDDQAVVAREAQNAGQVIESLKTNITVLEDKLREIEDTLRRKEAASQKMEDSLGTEVRDLQSIVKTKEEALQGRQSEINVLNSKIDVMTGQVSHLELAIEHARGEAASKTQQAEQVIDGLKIKIATLQAQLSQAEQIVGGLIEDRRFLRAESNNKALDNERNSQSVDLNTELEPHTNGVTYLGAETSVDTQAQAIGRVVESERSEKEEGKSTTFEFQAAAVTPISTENDPQTVSQHDFDRMIDEFSELSNVMGSIASLIIRDHVRAFGESMEAFPQARRTELIRSLSKTISDDKLKADFCQRFAKM
jgi:chromosome segregation ATPase